MINKADPNRPMIHIRLPRELVKRLDHVAIEWRMDRGHTIERLLDKITPGRPDQPLLMDPAVEMSIRRALDDRDAGRVRSLEEVMASFGIQ